MHEIKIFRHSEILKTRHFFACLGKFFEVLKTRHFSTFLDVSRHLMTRRICTENVEVADGGGPPKTVGVENPQKARGKPKAGEYL